MTEATLADTTLEYVPRSVGRPRIYKTKEDYNEAVRLFYKDYYAKNRAKIIDHISNSIKNRTPEQKERVRQRQREYYLKNREHLLNKQKEYKKNRWTDVDNKKDDKKDNKKDDKKDDKINLNTAD